MFLNFRAYFTTKKTAFFSKLIQLKKMVSCVRHIVGKFIRKISYEFQKNAKKCKKTRFFRYLAGTSVPN